MAKKPSLGRQRIQIAKIEAKSNLQVTFSKRRAGLFKKASELCTLCGVEIAIVVFSPAKKIFSFGHPEVRPIVDRYISRNPDSDHLSGSNNGGGIFELNMHLDQTLDEVEMEKERGQVLDRMRKSGGGYWWEEPVEKLGLQEVEQLRDAMEELRKKVGEMAVRVGVFDPYEFSGIGNLATAGMGGAAAAAGKMDPMNGNLGLLQGFFVVIEDASSFT